MKSVITLKNVWKTYQMGESEVHALQGVDLDIKQGEFVSIMGPSGSGKSTLVNMVGCLDLPTKGKIYLEGQDISALSESELATIRGKKIGFVFQTFNLIGTLTALENVTLPMIFQGMNEEERNKRGRKLLQLVDLEDRMHHKPGELSGGQRQRVAIARALANDPDIILADEPTGNLDTKTGQVVVEFLKKLHRQEKKTIIMVTHDAEIAEHASTHVRIRDGQVESKKR